MVKVVNQEEVVVEQGSNRELITALWIGAVVGASCWILTYLLSRYVIGSIACKVGSSIIGCEDSVLVAAGIALILANILGLVLLVRERTFRPLLIVLASVITLWGINGSWLETPSFISFLATIVASVLVYAVFSWFSRIRNFWLALGISVVLVVIFRLLIGL